MPETLIISLTPSERLPCKDLKWLSMLLYVNSCRLLTGKIHPPQIYTLKTLFW
ncbi:hypothetical protein NIES4075_63450 [Tolypothrix sp. NIES-4075]|nr:hypothetical protein NIES4075_63450 [Tolypothrix sp. NIES-4075]